MTVADGFRFGIGFGLATSLLGLVGWLVASIVNEDLGFEPDVAFMLLTAVFVLLAYIAAAGVRERRFTAGRRDEIPYADELEDS